MTKDIVFEVCTFCGEMFKEHKIDEYPSHYEKCRSEYKEDTNINNQDWEQHYY